MKHFILIKAYRNWLESNNLIEESPLPGLEHLTGDQLFFVNFAQVQKPLIWFANRIVFMRIIQVWCGHTRPEALRSELKTAVHAPGAYR